ncbi:MAG: riboflavin kinase [Egibacteraceae bacterium]
MHVEAFLLDFAGDLYDVEAAVDFCHRLCGQERHADVDALVTQMHADVAEARRLLH